MTDLLPKLAGSWEGISRVWFDPTKLEDESSVKGTMKLILNDKFILHEYEGSFKGKPLSGLAIYCYNADTKKFQSAWIDSFHSASSILYSQGDKGSSNFNVLGSYTYVTPEAEFEGGWRTEIELISDTQIAIRAFNIFNGEETRATEVIYNKTA